ncbi:MAG: hypothetical protein E6Q59_00960, partial [Nitrosomonas sp.]
GNTAIDLQQAISQLPLENWAILEKVVQFFHRVSLHGEATKMSISNLAILLGPCILEADYSDPLSINDTPFIKAVAEFMIENHETVFSQIAPVVN